MKQLTSDELAKLTLILKDLEAPMFRIYRKLNGGFSEAKMFDYDEGTIDVILEYGVQDGDENNVRTEQFRIDRETMKVIN